MRFVFLNNGLPLFITDVTLIIPLHPHLKLGAVCLFFCITVSDEHMLKKSNVQFCMTSILYTCTYKKCQMLPVHSFIFYGPLQGFYNQCCKLACRKEAVSLVWLYTTYPMMLSLLHFFVPDLNLLTYHPFVCYIPSMFRQFVSARTHRATTCLFAYVCVFICNQIKLNQSNQIPKH